MSILITSKPSTGSTSTPVVASYYASADSSITNGVEATIPLTTMLVDTNSAVSSNQFTVPVAGIYRISVFAGPDVTIAPTLDLYILARKNSTQIGVKASYYYLPGDTNGVVACGTWVVSCAVSDVLDARLMYANSGNRNISAQVSFEKVN